MTFIWPALLALLALTPLALLSYLRGQRRQRARAAQLGSLGMLQAAGRPAGARRHIPPALYLAGLALLIVAVARPQATVSIPQLEGTVVLAFDVSGSMAAQDLAPTRMEAAKAAARSFVAAQPGGVRIGVVAFSDGGLGVQAPTRDRELVLASIDRLAPERGTSVGQGILVALDALAAADTRGALLYSGLTPEPTVAPTPAPPGSATSAAIVLLTDGENNAAPDPIAAALAAAERGVRIYTVGIGSPAGTTLEVEGFSVFTRLDEPSLRAIAELTEGAYYSAATPEELQAVYDTLDLQLVAREESTELTGLVAVAGALLLTLGAALALLWFGRAP